MHTVWGTHTLMYPPTKSVVSARSDVAPTARSYYVILRTNSLIHFQSRNAYRESCSCCVCRSHCRLESGVAVWPQPFRAFEPDVCQHSERLGANIKHLSTTADASGQGLQESQRAPERQTQCATVKCFARKYIVWPVRAWRLPCVEAHGARRAAWVVLAGEKGRHTDWMTYERH